MRGIVFAWQILMRLFIALQLPDAVRLRLDRVVDQLRPIISARWIRSDHWHITLKFLGETPDPQLPPLIEALQTITVPPSIQLKPTGILFFPPRGPARIVAAAMDDMGRRCAALQAQIDSACQQIGFPLDARPWAPHVTLARPKSGITKRPQIPSGLFQGESEFSPDQFVLIESRLDRQGPTYVSLASFPR